MIQAFEVIREFEVSTAIAGRPRRLRAGEIIEVDTSQESDVLAFEMESQVLLVERSSLFACCKKSNYGATLF